MAAYNFENALPSNVTMPNVVISALSSPTASFSDNDGSELQSVLLRQWNAASLLLKARDQVGELAIAYAEEQEAADQGRISAKSDRDSALQNVLSHTAELNAALRKSTYKLGMCRQLLIKPSRCEHSCNQRHQICDPYTAEYRYCMYYQDDPGDDDVQDYCYDWASNHDPVQYGSQDPQQVLNVCQSMDQYSWSSCGASQGNGDTDASDETRCTDAMNTYTSAMQRRSDASVANTLAHS